MKLKEFLDLTGMPVAKFARLAHVSQSTIINILQEKYVMSLNTANQIEKTTRNIVRQISPVTKDELLEEASHKNKEGKKHQNQNK